MLIDKNRRARVVALQVLFSKALNPTQGSQEEMIAAGKDPEFYPQLGARIPLSRNGRPDDIGKAIVFLASEEASYITGITIRVDGGLILPGMPEAVRENMNAWGKTVK